MTTIFEVEHLYQPDGWFSPGYLSVGDNGMILSVSETPPENDESTIRIPGFGVPGLANLHSHAFQRALAGRCESVSANPGTEDNLWTWRRAMYDLVGRMKPDQYEAIAAFVYLEMVKSGMTAVGEFHYVHHAPGGERYDTLTEMSDRLISAAASVKIGITMLPVLYAHGGIGVPASEPQLRFTHSDVNSYLRLIEDLRNRHSDTQGVEIGMALHSLRAVASDEVHEAVAGLLAMDANSRIHIHVSETIHEVEEVQAGLGARPVQWLLDNVDLNSQWTLVHATHLDSSEWTGLAASGAVAGICPLTEATLGDGYFPLVEYHGAKGQWGIGTDSHYTTSIPKELQILECGKRLQVGRRNVIAEPGHPLKSHSGRVLFDQALIGGEQSLAQQTGALAPGYRADLVVLDSRSSTLLTHGTDTVLDAWLLSGTENSVKDVMIGGRWVVQDGSHPEEREIHSRYAAAMAELLKQADWKVTNSIFYPACH